MVGEIYTQRFAKKVLRLTKFFKFRGIHFNEAEIYNFVKVTLRQTKVSDYSSNIPISVPSNS